MAEPFRQNPLIVALKNALLTLQSKGRSLHRM
jgi:hypothetical protein